MSGFGNINLKIKPLKLAFLVDPNNEKQVREAIQLSSTVWGGSYCPIIPLYKKMPKTWKDGPLKSPDAKDVILGYIEAFDPDILVQFSKETPSYLKDLKLEIIDSDKIWGSLYEERTLAPEYGIGIFEILKDLFQEHFKYKAKYPIKVILPKLPKQHTTFWASIWGEVPAKLMPLIKKYYFEPLDITEPEFTPDKIDEYFKNDIIFSRRVTQHSLTHISRSGFRRSSYAFFMDATKIEDIIDCWNLRAMGRSVMPIPKQFISNDNYRELVIKFLKAHRVHWPHNNSVCDYSSIVRSRNSTMEELEQFAKTLNLKPEPNDPSQNGFFSLQHWYPRVWDEWARDKDGATPDDFYGEESTLEINQTDDRKVSFKPLLPEFAEKNIYHSETRCINEVTFNLYGSNEYLAEFFPKFSGRDFIRSISSYRSFSEYWRIGRNGLVRLVKDNINDKWEIPRSQNVVFAWLKDQGWEAKLSPPGLLAKQIFKKLDGHVRTLANEKLLGLIEHMNGGSVQITGQPIKNNRIHQQRELPIGAISNILKSTVGIFDYLVAKGIFHVGLQIQCPICIRRSWFPVHQIENSFICPLCLNKFPAIGNVENGDWRYKTTGPFSVPSYADGAYTTLLTLDFFNDNRLTGLKATPVLSFTAKGENKKDLEADFALFWQDSIFGEKQNGVIFGECKTYGLFENKDFDRMRYLAKNFHGSILVFATLRKTLTVNEIKEIARIAKAGRKYWKNERPINPVLILTGNELLTFHGPPYCWEGTASKDKFKHLKGLISICDATQQIYLNLPSWEQEWHDKWERQRQKRLKNKTT